MATSEEKEIFRNLVKQWLSKERAKQIVIKMRPKEDKTIKAPITTKEVIETPISTTEIQTEPLMTPAEPEEPNFLTRFKEWALGTPLLDMTSKALSQWGQPLVEKGQELMQEAQWEKAPAIESADLFSAQTGADLAANFIPDAKETLGEVMTMIWDIPWTLWAIKDNVVSLTKWWLDNKFEWTILDWVFDPTKEQKQIQDDFISTMQDTFINRETWELKNTEELSDDAKKHVRENPFVFLPLFILLFMLW